MLDLSKVRVNLELIHLYFLRNRGRDIFFPIFTRKDIKTKRIGEEIKTIISRLNDLSSSFSNHPPYFSGDYISQLLARIILIKRDIMLLNRDI